jgi:hypothetical protein
LQTTSIQTQLSGPPPPPPPSQRYTHPPPPIQRYVHTQGPVLPSPVISEGQNLRHPPPHQMSSPRPLQPTVQNGGLHHVGGHARHGLHGGFLNPSSDPPAVGSKPADSAHHHLQHSTNKWRPTSDASRGLQRTDSGDSNHGRAPIGHSPTSGRNQGFPPYQLYGYPPGPPHYQPVVSSAPVFASGLPLNGTSSAGVWIAVPEQLNGSSHAPPHLVSFAASQMTSAGGQQQPSGWAAGGGQLVSPPGRGVVVGPPPPGQPYYHNLGTGSGAGASTPVIIVPGPGMTSPYPAAVAATALNPRSPPAEPMAIGIPSVSPNTMCTSPAMTARITPSPFPLQPAYPATAFSPQTSNCIEDIPDLRQQFLQSQMVTHPGQVPDTVTYV